MRRGSEDEEWRGEKRGMSPRGQRTGKDGGREGPGRLETAVRVDLVFQDLQGGIYLGGAKFQH